MNIFSKQTRENYNESLEKILEKKDFSSETKNLLLSMLYKIENSYEDYYKVKPMAETKKEFIERILYIIKEECEYLETVTPKTENSKMLEEAKKNCIVDIATGRIVVYANEKDILYALIKLNEEYRLYKYYNQFDFNEQNTEINRATREFIIDGIAMSKSEVIRDFNGWSWTSNVNDIENIDINLIYQNILMLTDNKIENIEVSDKLQETNLENLNNEKIENTSKLMKEDNASSSIIAEALESIFLKEKVSELLKYINIIIYSNLIKEDTEVKHQIEQKLENNKKQLELMQDKKAFLDVVSKEKKKINEKIKTTDKLLNNKELLEKEYNKRNLELPNEKKIFSISHLDTIIEGERAQLLKEYKYLNKLLEPKEYIKETEKLKKECSNLQKIVDSENKEFSEEIIKDIQIEFLKCLKVKIESAEAKEEIIKLIYDFRYYCVLPINELQQIKDVPELREDVKEVMNMLIDKSIDKNIIENISNSVSLCYNTLKYVFESRIVDLEKMHLKITRVSEGKTQEDSKHKEYNILISLYDYKSEEEVHQACVNNLELLNIKTDKKIALFL